MTNSWSCSSSLLSIVVYLQLINIGAGQFECRESSCGDLPIRFPFRLRDRQPDHCGYPGFDLSCNDKNETLLHLLASPAGYPFPYLRCNNDRNETLLHLPASPAPIQLLVNQIDYLYNSISLSDPDDCIPLQFLKLNSGSISPFTFTSSKDQQKQLTSFFNCSPPNDELSCPIYTTNQDLSHSIRDLFFCTKLFDVRSVLDSQGIENLHHDRLDLWWHKNCSYCEIQGKGCKMMINHTRGDMVECYDLQSSMLPLLRICAVTFLAWASLVPSAAIAIFKIHQSREKAKDYARVENFLKDYRALKPTRFSYADLKRITSNFKDTLGKGAHGAVYRGKLSDEILVAVKVLNTTEGDGKEFINEVATMGKIRHINVVRLLGFCADGIHRAFVYNFFPNGSLQKFMSPPDNKDAFLGWEKLQRIAIGVAKGIEYLHQGCEQRILHFDINPHNVLLDDTLTPKITDFGLAKLCQKYQSAVSITAARGTLGYIAPEVLSRNFGFSRKFGHVSYKSDVYSFGILLIEMVGGRKNTNTSSGENFDILYPEWIYNLVERRDIHIPIEEEDDIEIAKKLAIVGLSCIRWDPVDRPSMTTVVQMLEGEGDNLAPPANPFGTSVESTSLAAMLPARRFNMDLEMIRE